MTDLNGSQFFTKGGQGKFFKDAKPVDQHRYQRGYTPERMNEVRNTHTLDITRDPRGTKSAFSGPHSERKVHETLARSTTPMDEFRSTPHGFGVDDYYPLHINTGVRLPGLGGNYAAGGYHDRGLINVADSNDENKAGHYLMHELGHYKSSKVEKNDSATYNTPARIGREEAFADDNMVSRFRPDPRDVRKGKGERINGPYESRESFHGLGGQKAHGPYVTARKTLSPEEKKNIRTYKFRTGTHKPKPFTHEVTGEHFSYGDGKWQKQGNLFAAENEKIFNDRRAAGESVRMNGNGRGISWS